MKRLIYFLFFSVILFSCEIPECRNTNPIFENYHPEDKEYKVELARQLQNADDSKISYWIRNYEEKNGKEFLYLNVRDRNICCIMELTMEHWNELDGVHEKKQ